MEQITTTLARYHDLTAVHLIGHGAPGALQLGGSILTLQELDEYGSAITSWGDALAEGADLLVYGCDLAADPDGKTLVSTGLDKTVRIWRTADTTSVQR